MNNTTIYNRQRDSGSPQLPTSRGASAQERSVFAVLRGLVPRRLLTGQEAELVAELQANRLLELAGLPQAPIPNELITELPRVSVRLDPDLPVSGSAQWINGRWLLSINSAEPWRRQRFSLAHELKHVLDHPLVDVIYAGPEAAEQMADQFAGCLLMPRRILKRAWGQGTQSLSDLADLFGVSERAVAVRLEHLGLRAPLVRHQQPSIHPTRPRGQYHRSRGALFLGVTA